MSVAPIVGTHRMTPRETHALDIDFTADLGASETLSSPGARLTDLATAAVTTPSASTSGGGKKVVTIVSGLTGGRKYHVELYATGSSGNVWAGIIEIECVQ